MRLKAQRQRICEIHSLHDTGREAGPQVWSVLGVEQGCLLVFRIKKTRHRNHAFSKQLIRAIKGRAEVGGGGVRVDNVKCHRVITVNKRNGKSQSWEILDRAGRVKKQEAILSYAVVVIQIFVKNQQLFIDFIDG